jgi:hypothetical protein
MQIVEPSAEAALSSILVMRIVAANGSISIEGVHNSKKDDILFPFSEEYMNASPHDSSEGGRGHMFNSIITL